MPGLGNRAAPAGGRQARPDLTRVKSKKEHRGLEVVGVYKRGFHPPYGLLIPFLRDIFDIWLFMNAIPPLNALAAKSRVSPHGWLP